MSEKHDVHGAVSPYGLSWQKPIENGAEREPQIERDDVPERSEDEIPF